MRKNYTAQLIESDETIKERYKDLLSTHFGTIVDTGKHNEALMLYNHYHPDVLVFGPEFLDGRYDEFLARSKNNVYLPVIIMVLPCDMKKVTQEMMDKYILCIDNEQVKQSLEDAVVQAKEKISQVDSFLSSAQMQKYVDIIHHLHTPSFICSGSVDMVRCNSAFEKAFDVTQEQINENVKLQDFIDRLELKETIRTKNLIHEQALHINGQELNCKIYILKQYEAYLVTFNTLSNENVVINMNLKRELQAILDRIDKNFDDHSSMQYKMLQLSTSIREFLQSNTNEEEINDWLKNHRDTLDFIEMELDYAILEELKHQPLAKAV
jgi:ribosomal protein S4